MLLHLHSIERIHSKQRMISAAYLIFDIIENYRLRCIILMNTLYVFIKEKEARYAVGHNIIPAYFQNNERVAIQTPTQ